MQDENLSSFECPSCQQSLSAPPELFGQTLTCPSCSSAIVVPFPATSPSVIPPPIGTAAQGTTTALWNPNAAASWSVLFTPIFGSYLLAQNAKALGRWGEAKQFTVWFWVSLVFYVASLGLTISTGENPLGFWGFILLIVWYFSLVKKQAGFISQNFGRDYVRQPWRKPILVGLASLVGVIVIAGTMADTGSMENSEVSEEIGDSGEVGTSALDAVSNATGIKIPAIGAVSDTVRAAKLYQLSGEEAISAARDFVTGNWTYTGQDIQMVGTVWIKWVVNEDGTMEDHAVPATSDDWGKPTIEEWEVITGKYTNTGARYYGFKIKGNAAAAFILKDGRLEYQLGDTSVIMSRGDRFPFSK